MFLATIFIISFGLIGLKQLPISISLIFEIMTQK